MHRNGYVTAVAATLAVVIAVIAQTNAGAAFRPAVARETLAADPSSSAVQDVAGPSSAPLSTADDAVPLLLNAPPSQAPSVEPVAVEPVAADPTASPEPARVAVAPPPAPVEAATAPLRTLAPAAVPPPTAAPPASPITPPAPTAAPVAACPANWFCYPRLGLAGPIVAYTDCGGSTDIGTAIRSFTCLSPFYLMGHAYTSFGLITRWRAGDVVTASGRSFTITGAFTQSSCAAPAQALAPLSLQTSLTSGGCGSVLVVQGS